jgi:N-hydroxyarylamine O-acetyltransferase
MLDLEAYLARIRWRGDLRPGLTALTALLQAHRSAIPFENLDVLLHRPVRLDLVSVQDKLVHGHRGGYCFEHGTLFAAVLEALGFAPVRHTARVVLFAPRGQAPRTHMFLSVPLAEGRYVVDPGFGGLAPGVPVPLVERVEAPADATHWMARDGDRRVLRARTAGRIVDCWVSSFEAEDPVDFEVGNHYTATHMASPFVNRLMLRAVTRDGSVSVMNRDVTHVRATRSNASQLADRAALRVLLKTHFGFDLPEVESMRVPAIEEWR